MDVDGPKKRKCCLPLGEHIVVVRHIDRVVEHVA